MKGLVALWVFSLTLLMVPAALLVAAEWVIFDEEVLYGELSAHDGGFEVSSDEPYEGKECLSRELIAGEWAWITGIGEGVPMNLDITGIDFDEAFIEFYIDSGTLAIGYMELRLAGAGWNPDCQITIETDAVEGYEQIRIPLSEFTVKHLGMPADDLDEFTGGTSKIDIWSLGFSPDGDTTVRVDNLRIADSDEPEPGRAVESKGKMTTLWAAVKSGL
jgi:hypothetical protein